jgi:hypothetical protein
MLRKAQRAVLVVFIGLGQALPPGTTQWRKRARPAAPLPSNLQDFRLLLF